MGYALTGGSVYGADFRFHEKPVYISDGVFVETPPSDCETIDVSGLKLIPGLIDIHFHGCMGHDFCEGETDMIQLIADYEEAHGITAICPATMTYPEEKLLKVAKAAKAFSNEKGAALTGIYMEGPFISIEKRGAQNPTFIQKPDADMFDRIQEASGGLIRLVGLAPETDGAGDFIEKKKNDVVISLAHSAADYDTALKAFNSGIHHVTHLYNGMKTMNHRKPGPFFAAADTENVEVELICDGIHVHPAVVRNTIRSLGDDRVIFISDSTEATGMEDGQYELGGLPITKKGNRATLADGTIAGSAANLMDCLCTAVSEMNIPLETAVKCCTANPARSIGIYDRYGSIEPGKAACLSALTDDLEIKLIFNRGVRIHYNERI